MGLHPWWDSVGEEVSDRAMLSPRARDLVAALATDIGGVSLFSIRAVPDLDAEAIHVDVEVERSQDTVFPIRAVEPIAILVSKVRDIPPTVLALRSDFPDTPHQNWTPEGSPAALCIDDRPWSEARLTFTPTDLIRRIQLWLSKAARGELHDAARPLDPIFFRAGRSIVIPRGALNSGSTAPPELVGFVHAGDQRIITAKPLEQLGGVVPEVGRLVVVMLRAQEQPMMRMRHAPLSIGALAREAQGCGIDLVNELQKRTAEWAGLKGDDLRRLSSKVAIVVTFPVKGEDGSCSEDLRAFVTEQTAGEIGEAVGALLPNVSDTGSRQGYLTFVSGQADQDKLAGLRIEPTDVHIAFDEELGAAICGRKPRSRNVAVVGAGALGSQLAFHLAREGYPIRAIVDDDRLLPHNLARHALGSSSIGLPKAEAPAGELSELVGTPVVAICADVLSPGEKGVKSWRSRFKSADLIIDASASVAVARHLSDLPGQSRRISAFFNPAGTAAIVLAESADRTITLRDLEAQYHRLVQTEPDFVSHLAVSQAGLRYSGSCRSATNRISASNAAILAGFAARAISLTETESDSSIRIWSMAEDGGVSHVARAGVPVTRITFGSWELAYDAEFTRGIHAQRDKMLPKETGGILLGIVDFSRWSIHLVTSLPSRPIASAM